ncbi:MAG: gamma-glutamyl-gamma-aminobutyrate hydrolase family protein [Candidatus Spyradocola sp.]
MKKPLIAIASLIYGDEFPPGTNYSNAVERAGGRPLFVCRALEQEDVDFVLQHFDGLLLTGGGDLCPETLGCPAHEKTEPVPLDRDRTEIALARAFFAAGKPILAICRGEQVLNVAMGGTHCQHIFDRPQVHLAHQNRETRHEVQVVPGTHLQRIFGGASVLRVNSTHHQAVETLAPCFTLAATSPDGVIEAYEAGENVLATQWHPERLLDEGMMPIWDWFVGTCRG